jgi:hypothetical protein
MRVAVHRWLCLAFAIAMYRWFTLALHRGLAIPRRFALTGKALGPHQIGIVAVPRLHVPAVRAVLLP